MSNEKINLKVKLSNNSSFVILIFVILKFRNIPTLLPTMLHFCSQHNIFLPVYLFRCKHSQCFVLRLFYVQNNPTVRGGVRGELNYFRLPLVTGKCVGNFPLVVRS